MTNQSRHINDNRWRMYAPDLGQYLSPDPLPAFAGRAPGPQAYAYAGGNPLSNVDPEGLYFIDANSWSTPVPYGGSSARLKIAKEALSTLRNDARCQCVFREAFGRVPFDDNFAISLGLTVDCMPANANFFGNSPYAYLKSIGEDAEAEANRRIEVDGRACNGGNAVNNVRGIMAHEMAHTSFLGVTDRTTGDQNPNKLNRICGGDYFGLFAYSWPVIKKCSGGCL